MVDTNEITEIYIVIFMNDLIKMVIFIEVIKRTEVIKVFKEVTTNLEVFGDIEVVVNTT